jgi:hypothetical protein
MRNFVGVAMNPMVREEEDKTLQPVGELVLLFSEPEYHAEADRIEGRRGIGDFRLMFGARQLREIAAKMSQYADQLDALGSRVGTAAPPTH